MAGESFGLEGLVAHFDSICTKARPACPDANKQDFENICQSAFIKIFSTLKKNPQKEINASFCKKVITNVYKDYMRAKGREKTIEIVDEISSVTRPRNYYRVDQELFEHVKEKMVYLSPNCFDLIEMRYLEELKLEDIKEIVNKSISRIHLSIEKCLEELKSLCEKGILPP